VGGRSADHVRQYANGLAAAIPADFWREIKAAGLLAEAAPVPRAIPLASPTAPVRIA